MTLNTVQQISARKDFIGEAGNTINLVSGNIDTTNLPAQSTNGKPLYFSDKNNQNLGSLVSGVYRNTDFDGVFTRLVVNNPNIAESLKFSALEVQARDNGYFYSAGISNLTHKTMAELATVDWVVQDNTANTPPQYVWYKVGNNLLITAGNEISINGIKTVTFPYPYKYIPLIQGTIIGILNPSSIYLQLGILNITTTSFQYIAYSNNVIAGSVLSHFLIIGIPA